MGLELITETKFGDKIYSLISKGKNAYDYIMGNKDTRHNYAEKASDKELKQTPFGAYMKGRFKMPKSAEASFDRDSKMLRLTFKAADVGNGQALVGALDPKNKDKNGSLYPYMTSYKNGVVTLEMPMVGDIKDRMSKDTSKGLRPDDRFKKQDNKKQQSGEEASAESMMTPVQVPDKMRSLNCDQDGHLILKEDADSSDNFYEEIDVKTVYDADGFTTDYTLYHDITNDTYLCILGDQDIYNPDNTEPDAEFDTEQEAMKWFESYEGIDTSSEYDDDEDPIYNFDSDEDFTDEGLDEDYWFGGDGKVDIPDRTKNDTTIIKQIDDKETIKDTKSDDSKDEEEEEKVDETEKEEIKEEATQVSNIGQHKMASIDLIENAEDSNPVTKVMEHYGTVTEPYDGPSFIMPDGSYLNIKDAANHSDVEYWLDQNGLSSVTDYNRRSGSPTLKASGCIRVDTPKYYIQLPDDNINTAQYSALKNWIDYLMTLNVPFLEVNAPGAHPVRYNFDGTIDADYITNRVRRYYITGTLYEDNNDLADGPYPQLDETLNLNLSSPNVTYTGPDDYEGTLEIEINGKKYKYKLNPDTDMTTQELANKVAKMQKYSDGKALAYLKKNTHVVTEGITYKVGASDLKKIVPILRKKYSDIPYKIDTQLKSEKGTGRYYTEISTDSSDLDWLQMYQPTEADFDLTKADYDFFNQEGYQLTESIFNEDDLINKWVRIDANYRGVTPKYRDVIVLSSEPGLATKDNPNPGRVYKVMSKAGKTFYIDEDQIMDITSDPDDKEAEAALNAHEAEYGADGTRVFSEPQKLSSQDFYLRFADVEQKFYERGYKPTEVLRLVADYYEDEFKGKPEADKAWNRWKSEWDKVHSDKVNEGLQLKTEAASANGYNFEKDRYQENLGVDLDAKFREVAKSENWGYESDKDIDDFLDPHIEVIPEDDRFRIEVRAEYSGYDAQYEMGAALDEVLKKYDPDAYFEPVDPGISEAYIYYKNLKGLNESISKEVIDDCVQDYKENAFGFDGIQDYVETQYPTRSKEFKDELVQKMRSILNESKTLEEKFSVGDHVQWSDNKGTSRDGIIRSFTLTNQDGRQVSAAVVNGKEIPIDKLEIVSTEVSEAVDLSYPRQINPGFKYEDKNFVTEVKDIFAVYDKSSNLFLPYFKCTLTWKNDGRSEEKLYNSSDFVRILKSESKEVVSESLSNNDIDIIKVIDQVNKDKGTLDTDESVEEIKKRLKDQSIEYDEDHLESLIAKSREMVDQLGESKQVKEKVSFKDHHICQGCGKPLSQCTCQVKEEE